MPGRSARSSWTSSASADRPPHGQLIARPVGEVRGPAVGNALSRTIVVCSVVWDGDSCLRGSGEPPLSGVLLVTFSLSMMDRYEVLTSTSNYTVIHVFH